ncbi:MAG: N-acetylmuramoyl-L-alanine amidase family protein [Bacillota bacterium]
MRILIDPGHGSRDSGAVGNGLVERDLTMFLALRTEERLDNYDCHAEIYQHPYVDGMGDLQTVVDYANNNGFDFFLSLHIDSVDDPTVTGFSSFRYPGSSRAIQDIIHASVAEYLAQHGINDRKAREADYMVLRETNMPSVLLETGFISSPWDSQKLKDIRFLDKLANAIAWGVVDAFKRQPRQHNCETCQQYLKATAEVRRLRQVIKAAGGILAPEMI